MSPSRFTWFILLSGVFAGSLRLAHAASAEGASPLWPLVLACGSVALAALGTSHARRAQGCTLWLASLPLLVLAEGAAATVVGVLACVLILAGLERFVAVRR